MVSASSDREPGAADEQPETAPSTGKIRRPSSLTVLEREAQADLQADQRERQLAQHGRDGELDARERQRARDQHRAEQRAGGHAQRGGRRAPRRRRCQRQQPVRGVAERGLGRPAAAAASPPPKTAISSGVSSTTTSTRRYCMKATSRSSAPRSSAIVTIPDAPPAIIPSVAVGHVERRCSGRAASPAPMLMPSVAALTSVTGSQSCAERRQRLRLHVGAERDAARPPARRGTPSAAAGAPACGRVSAKARPTTSAANSVGEGKPTALSASAKTAVAAPRTTHGAAARISPEATPETHVTLKLHVPFSEWPSPARARQLTL